MRRFKTPNLKGSRSIQDPKNFVIQWEWGWAVRGVRRFLLGVCFHGYLIESVYVTITVLLESSFGKFKVPYLDSRTGLKGIVHLSCSEYD